MSEAFPAIPRAFYRALLVSLLVHLGALLAASQFNSAAIYLHPAAPAPTPVIWVRPGALPHGAGAASRLLPPPLLAAPTPAPTPAASEWTRAEKKAEKKLTPAEEARRLKAEEKQRQRALAAVRELERKRFLASALQQVQQAVGKKGGGAPQPGAANASRPGSVAPPGATTAGEGEGGQISLEDYQYQEQVKAVFEKELNVVYGLRFNGQSLSTQGRVRVAGDGRVVEATISRRSGNYSFDAAVQNILARVKTLPPPPAAGAAFYLEKGFVVDFNPKN